MDRSKIIHFEAIVSLPIKCNLRADPPAEGVAAPPAADPLAAGAAADGAATAAASPADKWNLIVEIHIFLVCHSSNRNKRTYFFTSFLVQIGIRAF